MSDSLKDQLISLGLAKKQAAKPPRRHKKKKPGTKKGSEMSLDQAYRLRNQQEKKQANAKKEEKRLKDLERRRLNKEIQALVDAHGVNDAKAELKRNFLYKGRIRSVLCTREQLDAINANELGVVFLRGSYILMKPEHVELVKNISADHVPDLGGDEPADSKSDEDIPDEHKVPDDLIW